MKVLTATLTALIIASAAQAQYNTYDEWNKNYTVQALLGAVQFENLKFDVEDSQSSTDIDVSILPLLGAAWGTMPKGERFQYGLECSVLLGFRFDKLNYLYLGGGGAKASISISMWMLDLTGGPYASLFLDQDRKVRIYGGAGPLMTYANYRSDTDYPSKDDESNNESAFGIGLYARTGIEFRLHEKGLLGLGVRSSWASVDLSDVGGSSELTGIAAFISFTAGL